MVTLVGHPFDTVKVRLQTQSTTHPTYCEWLLPLAAVTNEYDAMLFSRNAALQLGHWTA